VNELQQVYKATDVGLVRKGNEDNLLVFDKVYAVADGMGGEAAGEVASQLLVNTVQEKLAGREQIREENLCQAIQDANMVIRHYVGEHPGCEGMGTTATLLHIDEQDGQAYWAHVGDSRLYILPAGSDKLTQVTEDHSYVEELLRKGTITAEEAQHHPQRNMLTRAVGAMENLQIDSGELAVHKGDVFLLATDGLMKHVTDEEIVRILRQAQDNPAQELINAALAGGGSDNVTVIVVGVS
jgi:protein phosphatase